MTISANTLTTTARPATFQEQVTMVLNILKGMAGLFAPHVTDFSSNFPIPDEWREEPEEPALRVMFQLDLDVRTGCMPRAKAPSSVHMVRLVGRFNLSRDENAGWTVGRVAISHQGKDDAVPNRIEFDSGRDAMRYIAERL